MIDRCCISINEGCNLACRYCHFSTEGRRSSQVGLDDVRSAINNIREYVESHRIERFKIGIVGGGEPMLRFPLLNEIVDSVAYDDRFRLYTISNGTCLTDDMLGYLHEHRERIVFNISLDGPEELHDANRTDCRGNGTFSKVMETSERYESLFGTKPGVNCTVTSAHIRKAREVTEFFRSNGFREVTFSRLFDDPSDKVAEADFNRLIETASNALHLRQIEKKDSYDCCKYGCRCGVGRTNLYYASSRIYPCGRFSGLEEYCLGSWDEDLDTVEERMKALVPPEVGTCYYDTKVILS